MADGIIIVDKPEGWTSMDVCARLRRIYGEKRIGHAGTLDPMATGVLPVFVGRGTRAVEFAEKGDKEYCALLRLGLVTDTQDTTGTVEQSAPVTVTREELEAVLPRFTGSITQIPPMYSALKQNGKKLYELARQGKTVERQPRSITISALEVEGQESDTDYTLRVACSKGTYIRTLCHDIGQALGCGGVMAALRRTRAAGFSLSQAVTMEEITAAAEQGVQNDLLLPVDAYFSAYPPVTVGEKAAFRCKNGVDFSHPGADGYFRVYGPDGEFLMLGKREGNTMHTVKSFFRV